MREVHESAAIAFEKYKRLIDRHQDLLRALAQQERRMPDYGSIIARDSRLMATCFGVELEVNHRVVANDGHFVANQYAFLGNLRGSDIPIHTIYLSASGLLSTDTHQEKPICNLSETYLAEHLVSGLAAAYLHSNLVRA